MPDRKLVNVTGDVFASLSEKMERPYELEAERINSVVDEVKDAKRAGDFDRAIAILVQQLDLWEKDSAAGLGGVAPWYYEQCAIIYRRLGKFDDEIAVLERFARQQHAPGASPPQLLERLKRAKLRKSGVKPPPLPKSPAIARSTEQIDTSQLSNSFIALDVETANSDSASICSIGLVHFREGQIFKSLTILVDPEDHFLAANINIHGIRPEDVAGKPTMAKIFPVISTALEGCAIVHHSAFDRTALARAAGRYGADGLPCIWVDSCQIARQAWPEFKGNGGYGLAHLCHQFSIEFEHHNASEDARAAGIIVQRAIAQTGISFSSWVEEIGYRSTAQDYVPRRIKAPSYAAQRVAATGFDGGPLSGETIVFTGSLSIERAEAARLATAAGSNVEDGVNKRTTILVVGDQDIRLTKGQEKSTKHRKVESMIEGGAAIRIVRESDFMLMVG